MSTISKLLVSIQILLPFVSFGQDWNRVLEYEMDAEYQMSEKQFEKAAETYLKALKIAPNSANLKFKAGYCYLKTDDMQDEALLLLEEASENVSAKYDAKSIKETQAPPEAIFHLGRAYQFNFKYDKAIEYYNKYKEFIKIDDPGYKIVEQSIKDCQNSKNTTSSSVRVKITNLGKKINDNQSNINPVFSGDGLVMAYTTQAKKGYDIFISRKVKDSLTTPQKITSYLGDNYYKTVSLSNDGSELILVLDDPINSDLFVTTYDGKRWSKAIKLNKIINSKYNETHACFSPDENTVYFTSDRKGGLGGLDIYKTIISSEGEWSKPENLGPKINTEFNEDNPFISPDGKMLFFSSEGHNGYGGYDIYYTKLEGDLQAVNLGYPLNDARNNNFYFPDGGLESGYTAICNQNGFGKNDIVQIQLSRLINLKGLIIPENLKPDENPNFIITLVDIDQNDTMRLSPDQNNSFTKDILPGKYQLSIKGNKYQDFNQDFSVPSDFPESNYSISAELKPVVEIAVVPEVKVETVVAADSSKLIAQIEIPKPQTVEKKEEKKEVIKQPEKIVEKPIEPAKDEAAIKRDTGKKAQKSETILPPKKDVVKPVVIRRENSSEEGSIEVYSVQLMALDKLISTDFFKGLSNIEVTTTQDGIYRYNAGSSESMETAMQILRDVQAKGYPKAFIRIDKIKPIYRIQLLALRKAIDISYFANLSDVKENKGHDGFYRYFVGEFATKEEALSNLQSIRDLGYKDAFVKKVLN